MRTGHQRRAVWVTLPALLLVGTALWLCEGRPPDRPMRAPAPPRPASQAIAPEPSAPIPPATDPAVPPDPARRDLPATAIDPQVASYSCILVSPGGAAVRDTLINATLRTTPDTAPLDSAVTATDRHGAVQLRFRLPDGYRGEPSGQLVVRAHRPGRVHPRHPVLGSRRLALAADQLPPGHHDLGTVELPALPLLASGYFVDDLGRPAVASTTVASTTVASTIGRTAPDTAEQPQIRQVPAEGRFWVFGPPTGPTVAIQVHPAALVPPGIVTLPVGARDHRVVLQRHGALRADLRLPGDAGLRDLWRLQWRAEGGTATVVPPGRIDGAGNLHLPGLVPGSYRLQVFLAADDHPVVDIAGIRVRPGAASRDPRLDALDLTAGWRAIELRVVDDTGRPVPRGLVLVRRGADSGTAAAPAHAWALENGLARIYTARQTVSVEVRAAGFRTAHQTNPGAAHTLRLAPGIPVDLELAARVPAGYELVLTIRRRLPPGTADKLRVYRGATGQHFFANASPRPGPTPRLVIGPGDRSVRAWFGEPGRYRLVGTLQRRRDGATATLADTARDLQVDDGPADQRITLDWTAAQLLHAVRQAR